MTPREKSLHPISRAHSIKYALHGFAALLKQEPNCRIHLAATVVAVIAGFVRHLSQGQWIAIIFAIGIVWITEALNTCIEKLCNIWCDNQLHDEVKVIKDIAAAAVLAAAIVSVIIAIIVFFF
jgi:diacylglycerol kinase